MRHDGIDPPVFLVSCERSGSTLLTHMLDHHPQMAWALALEFALSRIEGPGRWPAIDAYHRYLENEMFFRRSGFAIDRRLGYVDLVHDFLAQERTRKRKPFAGAAVHHYFDRLPWLFPDCRFVHLVRDPRDVSLSAIGLGIAGNVWRGAAHWVATERLWDELSTSLAGERVHEVRFEALVREPRRTLEGICTFIGVPYAEEMLDYPRGTSYAPVDATLAERWRRAASEREVRIAEAVAGPLLEKRGYRPSGLPPLAIGWLERQWLREHDRYGRVRHRIARNGLRLTIADFVARRAGLTAWARRVRAQLDAIESRTLE